MSRYTYAYVWPHIVKGETIGEIRRMVDATDGSKMDLPYYDKRDGQLIAGASSLEKPWPLMGLDTYVNMLGTVYAPEGQKKGHAYRSLGYQAVNAISGSGAVMHSDWSPIATAKEIVVPYDDDEPGIKYAHALWQFFKKTALQPKLWFICFKGIKKGGDVCDWIKLQPGFENWNELDALDDHPRKDELIARLDAYTEANKHQALPDWKAEQEWLDPEKIDTALRPVHRLPVEMLPPAFAEWIQDVAYRMQSPLEYAAVAAIVMAGAVIGSACGVRPKRNDDWTVYPNLWGIITGPPGSLKSPVLAEMVAPLHKLDSASFADYAAKKKDYDAERMAYDARLSDVKTKTKAGARASHDQGQAVEDLKKQMEGEPTKPPCKRFLIHDATVEAMCVILQDNPRGVLLFQDELYGLLTAWDQDHRAAERPFYLAAWNGNVPHTVNRITRDSVRIESATVSILGGMQPDTLRRYMVDSCDNMNDGLMQRFQLSIYLDQNETRRTGQTVDARPNNKARQAAHAVVEQISKTNFKDYGALEDPEREGSAPFYRFDDQAQQFFFEWYHDLQQKMSRCDDSVIEQHLSKYQSLMPSLALIFHVIAIANGTGGMKGISLQSAELAAAWCDLLEEHARRIYGLSQPGQFATVQFLAQKLEAGAFAEVFTARDVMRKQWKGLRDQAEIDRACASLVEHNWLRKVEKRHINGKGGRPSVQYHINPKVGASKHGRQVSR